MKALKPIPNLIVTSPLARATQTALIGLRPLISKGVPIVAHEDCREHFGVHACDFRRPLEEIAIDYPVVDSNFLDSPHDPNDIDFFRENREEYSSVRLHLLLQCIVNKDKTHISSLTFPWHVYICTLSRYNPMKVAARGFRFMDFLRSRPEKRVAVTSHSGFLFVLFNAVFHCGEHTSLQSFFSTGTIHSCASGAKIVIDARKR